MVDVECGRESRDRVRISTTGAFCGGAATDATAGLLTFINVCFCFFELLLRVLLEEDGPLLEEEG